MARRVEVLRIRIRRFTVNCECRRINGLASFGDYGEADPLDVGVEVPMVRCTLRAGRMTRRAAVGRALSWLSMRRRRL